MALISGEQGNKGQILRGTGEQRQYWGTGNTKKHFRFLEKKGSQSISGEQGNMYPHWEGLNMSYNPNDGSI